MVEEIGDTIPFLAINDVMDDDYREAMVKRALDYRTEATQDARRCLNRAIRKAVRVKGYRNPERARTHLLLRPVIESCYHANELMGSLLWVWVESQPDLRAVVQDFLNNRGDSTVEFSDLDGFQSLWSVTEMVDAGEALREIHPHLEYDDVALMLCCLKGTAPVEDQLLETRDAEMQVEEIEVRVEEIDQEEVRTLRWDQWLEELRALPAKAPEWDAVPAFMDALAELMAEKLEAREATVIQGRLQEALDDLVEQTAEELEYFGLGQVVAWSGELCTADEARALLEEVIGFRDSLIEHREMRLQSPTTLAETRERRKVLGELEERVLETYARLATSFQPVPPPEEPEPTPEGSAPETEEASESEPALPEEEPPGAEPGAVAAAQTVGDREPDEETLPALDATAQPEDTLPSPEVELVEAGTDRRAAMPEQLFDAPPTVAEPGLEVEKGIASPEEYPEKPPAERLEPRAAKAAPVEKRPRVDAEPETARLPHGELRSAKAAATLVKADYSDEHWDTFLWALVAEDDLPAAYWLIKSRAASGSSTPLPAGLLAAAQAARWLSPDSDAYVYNLLEIVQSCPIAREPAQEMIGLAAALRPALLAPHSGLAGWLEIPSCHPALRELASAIGTFADQNIRLRPEDLKGVAGAEQREAALREASWAAMQWLDEAPERRTKLKRATDVWRWLATHDLREMLLPVSENSQANSDKVRQRLENWQQHGFISSQIDQLDMELSGKRSQQIFGSPRQQIMRLVEDACGIAAHWCNLVEHERTMQTRGPWHFDRIAQLHARLQQIAPRAEQALVELGGPEQPTPMAAASGCLRRSLQQLCETLALQSETAATESLHVNRWESLRLDAGNLEMALERRLFWLPELSLTDDGQPTRSDLHDIATALLNASRERRSLMQAFEGWLQKQDYRFADDLASALSLYGEADPAKLSAQVQESMAGSRAALRAAIEETIDSIEQAYVDGIIADERSEYSAKVEAVDPAETQEFASKYAALESVRTSLSAARQNRLAELQAIWQALEQQLGQSNIEPELQVQVREFMQEALGRGDTRVVEEGIAPLRVFLDSAGKLEKSIFTVPESRDHLGEFVEAQPEIESWLGQTQLYLVSADIRSGHTRASIAFGDVEVQRRTEAANAVEAWRKLKQQRPWGENNAKHIATLLEYLGFSAAQGQHIGVEAQGEGQDWLHMQASMTASGLARPIPQFGSLSRDCYDLVCFWDSPGPALVAARLQNLRLGAQTVIVLFLGRLSMRQRADLVRTSRAPAALAILDETLLVFLAKESDARLPAFLRCALPLATINPYTPFQAGDVPPEMFYGREGMAEELQRPSGSCLVYGGRQLGKSALLRHVSRHFHYPARKKYSWVENLKLIFLPEAGKETDNIWRALRESFKEQELLSKRVRTDRPEEIARRLREVMDEIPDLQVLVMFDEADDFLDADSADGFRQIIGLRELMLQTGRRFKVIFAGLHSVQRFQGIPDQPLAHYGQPLCVGPLERAPAQALVREPFEVLGYRFDDNATVLRVLSYTNYHPGLIQLFCQEMLQELRTQRSNTPPPYRFDPRIIGTVYRKPQVSERIRERFDWTLALDMRYQAIAWALIEDQMETPDSYARAYPPGDIEEMVRGWWPQGFREMGFETLRGYLDEMVGLGVLVRNKVGHYRLRSPNVVRLMGTDIEDRLLELADKQPPQSPVADHHHAPLDKAFRHYSPLTYAQERSLNPPGFGVGMVFASKAGGSSALAEAFQRLVPPDLPDDTSIVQEVPRSVLTGGDLSTWLGDHMDRFEKQDRQILFLRPSFGPPEELGAHVETALSFCDRYQSRERWVRLLFICEPRSTWKWLALAPSTRRELEDRSGAVVFAYPWNLVGIRQRLAQHDKMHADEVCQQVLQATGGWHYLVEELFERCGARDDPRPFAEQIATELKSPGSQLRQDFFRSLELDLDDAILPVLRFIAKEAEPEISIDYVTPEFIGASAELTPEQCARATEFLQRMACVKIHDGLLRVDGLVKRLILQP